MGYREWEVQIIICSGHYTNYILLNPGHDVVWYFLLYSLLLCDISLFYAMLWFFYKVLWYVMVSLYGLLWYVMELLCVFCYGVLYSVKVF